MITKLIGIGAGGNKAAICAVKNQVIDIDNTMLINSTLKDIPKDYDGTAIEFSNSYGGCGKERKMSYELCSNSIQDGTIPLEDFLHIGKDDQAELVVLVSSTEGGTGSGSTPLLAKYIREVFGISVHVFLFIGFQEDVRGTKNTVEVFQELQNNFATEAVKLKKYLPECNNNRIKAEEKADIDFCKKLSVLIGLQLRDSDHNIDPTDLLKISTTDGYMVIESAIIEDKIKNRDQFRKVIIDMIDNSKTLDIDTPSQTRLAVIININKDSTDYIDYDDIITERFGQCYDKFEHIQDEGDMEQFVAFISAGSKMPMDELEAVYDKYHKMTSMVNKDKDAFFGTIRNKAFLDEDASFDIGSQKKNKAVTDKANFFNNLYKEKAIKESNDEF